MRHVSTGTDFVHDLFGVIVVQTRPLVLDIHAVVVIGRAVELEEFFFVDDCLDETGVNEVVGEIIVEAAVLIVFGVLADSGLDGILMNVAEDDQELVVGEDGPAFEGGLEEASDALVPRSLKSQIDSYLRRISRNFSKSSLVSKIFCLLMPRMVMW